MFLMLNEIKLLSIINMTYLKVVLIALNIVLLSSISYVNKASTIANYQK